MAAFKLHGKVEDSNRAVGLYLRTTQILPSPRRAGLAVLLWILCTLELRPASQARGPVVLPLAFHVAVVGEEPVVADQFLVERLARANEIFAPYGVQFTQTEAPALGADHAVMESASDRDALGAMIRRGVINCFVVKSLRDVDDPTQMRRGVHWHSRAYPGTHYVVLSSIAGPNVLAHELGHFLGNPSHSDTPGNLMSYQRGEGLPFLDARQARRVARAVRGYLNSGELRALRDTSTARARKPAPSAVPGG